MTAPSTARSLGNWNRCREPRLGVMLHYDASASDAGAVEWLTRDTRCTVSYTDLVLDDGTLTEIAPLHARAWHAGVCRPSSRAFTYVDANSAFYGLAIAAAPGERVTPAQLKKVVERVAFYFARESWPLTDTWRVTSHRAEAWPRGRKSDPEPVMLTTDVRRLLPLEEDS